MTRIDREADYGNPTTALDFVLRQMLKDVYTAMPGIVESYDAATKRARVRGAIRVAMSDGETVARKPIVNVPVLAPAAGGYVLHFPLQPDDAVLLVFSMRGLAEFKRTFAEADPTLSSLLSEKDAVAIPGFGALGITPATTSGVSLQREDGTTAVHIDGDDVTILVPDDGKVFVGGQGGQELATKEFVRDQYNAHIHATPMGPSGPPTVPSPLSPGPLTEKQLSE